ncbi:MAG: glycoside hydrolase family 43 protein [Lachnospiraceae bacterium]|nr:glycoside hydrolase family 43 protein [Lachnospiraceae bacterium]
MAERTFFNPIIPGFYPDPSILRVEDDYYLINSSFSLFPGIPVFHSKDLVNWEQIGNALDRVDQHFVTGASVNGGVMAPTIRYQDGVFYIIVANFAIGGNIMITATDPAGPWSDPVFLEDIPGIDASIFFDDDGKCYAQGTGSFDDNYELMEGMRFGGNRGIWVCEFDVKTMKAVSPKKYVWNCALNNASSPEAPHLYKKDGWYYLVIAEGGTEHYHAVTVARSREVMGLYEGFRGNPILTHRHLGYDYPLANVGHADIVELPDGSWYGVALASRFLDGYHKNLGRETVLFPVTWQNDWPVFCPMTGKVELSCPVPACLPWTPAEPEASFDDFDSDKLAMYWTTIGTPKPCFYELKDSALVLDLNPRSLRDEPYPMRLSAGSDIEIKLLSYVARRQRSFSFDFTASMDFEPLKEGESAGVLLDHDGSDYVIEYGCFDGQKKLRVSEILIHTTGNFLENNMKAEKEINVLAEVPWDENAVVLRISEREDRVLFFYGKDCDSLTLVRAEGDARKLNVPVDGGMVGAVVGVYASANGEESSNKAAFAWTEYKDL